MDHFGIINNIILTNTYNITFTQAITRIQPNTEIVTWPTRRIGQHAACCLGFNSKYPQLLISAGRPSEKVVLDDAWIFDLASQKWREVN